MAEKRVSFLLRWLTDRQAVTEAVNQNERLNQKIEEMRTNAERLNQRFGELEDVATRSAAAAVAAFAPLIASAQKYVEQVGNAEAVSRKWLALTERQTQAQIDFGRKSAEALLPYREALVDVLEMTARVDPQVLQAGIAGASVLAGVATVGLIASQVGRLYAGIVLLSTSIKQLAASQGVRSGVGYAGAGIIGVGAGIEISRAIGRETGNEQLANVDLNTLIGYLADTLKLLVAVVALAGKTLEEQFNSLRTAFERFLLDLEYSFKNFPVVLEKIWIGLQLALLDIVDATGIPGVKSAVADALGIDEGGLRSRADQLGSGGGFSVDQQAVSDIIAANRVDGRYGDELPPGYLNINDADTFIDAINGLVDIGYITQEGADQIAASLDDYSRRQVEIEERAAERDRSIQDRYTEVGDFLVNLGKGGGGSSQAPAAALSPFADEALLDEFESFQQEQADIQKRFQEQRTENARNFQKQLLNLERTYNQQTEAARERHLEQLGALDKNYDKSQAERTKDFNKSVASLREDYYKTEKEAIERFQLERVRAEENYQDRIRDAASKRDAVTLLQIYRERSRTRKEGDQDFKIERKQSKEQFADSINDLAANYQEQRQLANENYQEQRRALIDAFNADNSERRRAHEQQMNETRRAYAIQQQQLVANLNNELNTRATAYRQQLNQLIAFQNAETGARAAHYAQLQQQLGAFMYGRALQNTASNISNAVSGLFSPNQSGGRNMNVGATNVNINNTNGLNEAMIGRRVKEEMLRTFNQMMGR